VQHLLGIGHLARASRIAAALKGDGWDVTLAQGGMPVAGFPGEGIATVSLPPIKAGEGFSALVDEAGGSVDETFKSRRRDLLLKAFDASEADVLIVEAFPFGRRQMRFELLPLLDIAKARGVFVASSIRDILQESRKPERVEETVAAIGRSFDLVLVHGDPSFARLEETFPLASRIEKKIAYTGLVAPPPPKPSPEKFDVIVSAGGGAAGARVLLAAAEAMRRVATGRWCFIAGPNLDAGMRGDLRARLSGAAELHAFRRDFPSLLMSAKASVSQAGYNTVCDLLRARCRAVLVPFAEGGETEQTLRAERLGELGLARVVREYELSAESLAEAIESALAGPAPNPTLDLEGAAGTARVLRQAWLAARRRRL
jgi:predicted glycosyltransferase